MRRTCIALTLIAAALGCGSAAKEEQRAAALREAGIPVTTEDLEAAWPIPVTGNGAAAFRLAFDELEKLNARIGDGQIDTAFLPYAGEADLPEPGTRLPDEIAQAAGAYVTAGETALGHLTRGLAEPDTQFVEDWSAGFDTDLPHLGPLRDAARLLAVQSLFDAEIGRLDEAVAAAVHARQVANTLTREPLYISQLVRIAIAAVAFEAAERMINAENLTASQLERLSDAWSPDPDGTLLATAWQGEFVINYNLTPAQIAQSFVDAGQATPLTADEYEEHATADRAALLDFYRRFMDASRLPLDDVSAAVADAAADAEALPESHLRTRGLVELLAKSPLAYKRYLAQHRLVQAAAAIERFRLGRGAPPETLDALVPTYFESVPTDPFDGAPLRYQVREPGYILYSIGDDEADNGGRPRARTSGDTGWDIPLRVRR